MKLDQISKHLKEEVKGNTFITFKSKTPVKTLKKGHPFGDLWKVAVVNVSFNSIYEKSVNRKLKKLGEVEYFKAGKLPWGEFKPGYERMIIHHKGEDYLRCQPLKEEVSYYDSTSDKVHLPSEVRPYLRSRKELVKVRAYKLSNIEKIKINKTIIK